MKYLQHLRSSPVCSPLPRFLSFITRVPNKWVSTPQGFSSSTLTFSPDAFHAVPTIVIVVLSTLTTGYGVQFVLNVDLLSLQQLIHNLPQLQISRTEIPQVTLRMLRFGLQPEQMPSAARLELEDEYSTVRRRFPSITLECLVGLETAVARHHHKIDFGISK